MLISSRTFEGVSLMSLQTGAELGVIEGPIIDPHRLKIVAYYVGGDTLDIDPAVIRIEDIREIGDIGFIIDSNDEIVSPEDITRLQEIIDLKFELEGIKVVDEKRRSLGKVIDYNVDTLNFNIEQLRIKPPLLKTIQISELLIHRKQIIEVSNEHIVVKSATKHHGTRIRAAVPHAKAYVNPFRAPQPEQ